MNSAFAHLAELAANASATRGDATERAQHHSGEAPLMAAFLFPPVAAGSVNRPFWVIFTSGTLFDLGLVQIR